VNLVGTVDLYQTANHGTNNAKLAGNGARAPTAGGDRGQWTQKGASAETFQTVESSPGLEDYWQAHYLIAGGEKSQYQAGLHRQHRGSPDGKWIKVSAQRDGAFTVTNTRNNFSKTYKPRK